MNFSLQEAPQLQPTNLLMTTMELSRNVEKSIESFMQPSSIRLTPQELSNFVNSILKVGVCDLSFLTDLTPHLINWIIYIKQAYPDLTKDDPCVMSQLILLLQTIFSTPVAASVVIKEIRKGAFASKNHVTAPLSKTAIPGTPSSKSTTSSTETATSKGTSSVTRSCSAYGSLIGLDSFLVSNDLIRQVVFLDSAINYKIGFGFDTFLHYVSDVVCAALEALDLLRSMRTEISNQRFIETPDSVKALYLLSDSLRYGSFFGCMALATYNDAPDLLRFVTKSNHTGLPYWDSFVCNIIRIGNSKSVYACIKETTSISQTQNLRFSNCFLLQFLDHEPEFELVFSKCIPTLMLLAVRTVHEATPETRNLYQAFNEARSKLSVNSFCCMLNYAVCNNVMRTLKSNLPSVIVSEFSGFKLPPLAKWDYTFSEESFILEGDDAKQVNMRSLFELLVINLDTFMATMERELIVLSSFEVDSLKFLLEKLIQAKLTTCMHSLAAALLLLNVFKDSEPKFLHQVLEQKVYQAFWFLLSLPTSNPELVWLLLMNLVNDICKDDLKYTRLFENLLISLVKKDNGILKTNSIISLLSRFATTFACHLLLSNLGISSFNTNHMDLVVPQSEVARLLGIQKSLPSQVPCKRAH